MVGEKPSTTSFILWEKPIELQHSERLPEKGGFPRHVCTTNSHLNEDNREVMVLMCFLHIPSGSVGYPNVKLVGKETPNKNDKNESSRR